MCGFRFQGLSRTLVCPSQVKNSARTEFDGWSVPTSFRGAGANTPPFGGWFSYPDPGHRASNMNTYVRVCTSSLIARIFGSTSFPVPLALQRAC